MSEYFALLPVRLFVDGCFLSVLLVVSIVFSFFSPLPLRSGLRSCQPIIQSLLSLGLPVASSPRGGRRARRGLTTVGRLLPGVVGGVVGGVGGPVPILVPIGLAVTLRFVRPTSRPASLPARVRVSLPNRCRFRDPVLF